MSNNSESSQRANSSKSLPQSETNRNETDIEDEGLNLQDIVNDYLQEYNKKYIFDSTIINYDDTFKIKLNHYCLFDSTISIPQKYLEIYGLNNFVTHQFVSTIKIIKNGQPFAERSISKQDFSGLLNENLKLYGVLFFPNIEEETNEFSLLQINYSISIPLTDIGIGMAVLVDENGIFKFIKR